MGRHKKTVLTSDGLDRRATGYYSTPKLVSKFISQVMLEINPNGDIVLDPCVGQGEMVDVFISAGKQIVGYDVINSAIDKPIHFIHKDFLMDYAERTSLPMFNFNEPLHYDYYIANPPYNCHESDYIRKNKSLLQSVFPEIGVANMYSMFISAMINLAKPDAVLGIITNDSFLTSRMHENLRKQILNSCQIRYLLLCPNDLFRDQGADVRTCILILMKNRSNKHTLTFTLDRPASTSDFYSNLKANKFDTVATHQLILQSQLDRSEFIIGCPESILTMFSNKRLGEIAKCITGISTGNDSEYLLKAKASENDVPFYKNPGKRKFWTDPDAFLPNNFMKIASKVPNFIVRNKSYLFKEGITCSSMGIPFSACYLPKGSTYGVNANVFCENREDIFWLIGYLNSNLVTYIVRGVLLRTNMITSGYVSRIPIPNFSCSAKEAISTLSKLAIESKAGKQEIERTIQQIDLIVYSECNIPILDQEKIQSFCGDLVTNT